MRLLTDLSKKELKAIILTGHKPVRRSITIPSSQKPYVITRLGVGSLITPYGKFWLYNFRINDAWKTYHVLIKAPLDEMLMPVFTDDLPLQVRIDSGCLTGQVFGDMTCDCQQQLYKTMARLTEGIIICIPTQDGRGMGTPFKLTTLLLQEYLGLHTVAAARLLSGSATIDKRDYLGAMAILRFFNIPRGTRIDLATNNPHKLKAVAENGYTMHHRTPVVIKPTLHTKNHLEAKEKYLHHML